MPDWDDIFREKGVVFTKPHSKMPELVRLFRSSSVQSVLDLGCGTGRHILLLANEGFDVQGFDTSSHALEITRQRLKDEGLTASIIQHRMEERFPYEDSSFDAVISTQVIHHNRMEDILKTIREIERVIRDGGLIFITFPILTHGPISEDDDWDLEWIEPNTYIPRKGPEAGIPHHYFTQDEIDYVFKAFTILEDFRDETRHRCLLGKKK